MRARVRARVRGAYVMRPAGSGRTASRTGALSIGRAVACVKEMTVPYGPGSWSIHRALEKERREN